MARIKQGDWVTAKDFGYGFIPGTKYYVTSCNGESCTIQSRDGHWHISRFVVVGSAPLEGKTLEKQVDDNWAGFHTKPSIDKQLYIIGSLRNPKITEVAKKLRSSGLAVFDDWYAAGPEADDYWKKYEQDRGRTYIRALQGAAARNVYEFDKRNLDASDAALLVQPAGKSGHLELGYMAGKGKKTFILLDAEQDRWDVMMQFATAVFYEDDMLNTIKYHMEKA